MRAAGRPCRVPDAVHPPLRVLLAPWSGRSPSPSLWVAHDSSDDARRLAAAASDEDYFPAFLTATPSAPKASKAKASAPANTRAKRYADGGAFKAKPRLRMTFAESLAMDKKRERLPSQDDSPFALGGADAIDRTYVRKRKPFNPAEDAPHSRALEDDADLDDAPPPPTVRFLPAACLFLAISRM